ncbi:MAG: UDP-2,3-diacylglucosamine diphosphatase LpxI [Rhodospirillaceae bacterium]|jgi:hypothetical protein|nr:UDP-2,3-diacylglucosamine diphosphatase LpxI [Rhodospirillaceae bacterium]MBT4589271.1 UDP-2,3-diacylglucosamine diphosphatase LpxI [Rhodospirillaceae bacterium]MBT5941102.1 UDP-2,3-diacylglucosamine diphosphatase LpxI [Rhodospirillaceae bacterium]
MQPKLGIIAGGGNLPRRIIDVCRATQRAFYVIAVEGHALADELYDVPHSWLRIGTAASGIKILKQENVQEIVMIGDVKMPSLRELRPDLKTAAFFAKIGTRALGDNSLLSAVAQELEKEGFKIIGVDEILNDLLAPEGLLGAVEIADEFSGDVKIGIEAALQLGARDIGQAVIVRAGDILLEEDRTGTAAMMVRGRDGELDVAGGLLVKLKKPGQDRRMDLPTIGADTIQQAHEAGLKGIVIQAGETLIVDLAAMIAVADEAGIFVQAITLGESD